MGDKDYPFSGYKSAWTVFRENTNETSILSSHLSSQTNILNNKSILDLGCGDGALLTNILDSRINSVKKAILVEYDNHLILQAKKNLEILSGNIELQFLNTNALSLEPRNFYNIKAILGSHVFYFFPERYILKLLKNLSRTTTLYAIFDDPSSIFGSFWKHTAPFYHRRLAKVHNLFSKLSKHLFNVKKSTVEAKMVNPLILPTSKKISVLSLLCYRDANKILKANPDFIYKTIEKFDQGTHLKYNSFCYEISRSK